LSSVKSWLITNCVDAPFEDYPPVYTVVFDPSKPFFDPVNRTLNRFSPPQLPDALPDDPQISDLDPSFWRLVSHVIPDPDMAETFLDWVAFIYQTRTAPQSAWLLHGSTGTGKDLTMNILRQVLGPRYCRNLLPHMLTENFNGWIEETNLVYVNEIDTRVFKGNNLSARLNDYITAEYLSVRKMRADSYEVRNYAGYVFSSNRMDAVELQPNDRRFHVPPRQEEPLLSIMSQQVIDRLVAMASGRDEESILALRGWFHARLYDEPKLRRPQYTEAKAVLADASQPAATRLSAQLMRGRWAEIVDHLEPYETLFNERGLASSATDLVEFFKAFVEQCGNPRTRKIAVTRNELRAIFAAACDPRIAQMAPAKFRQYLLHNEFLEADHLKPLKRGGVSVRGVSLPLPKPEDRAHVIDRLSSLGYLTDGRHAAVHIVK
jgi:hypothetical protein